MFKVFSEQDLVLRRLNVPETSTKVLG